MVSYVIDSPMTMGSTRMRLEAEHSKRSSDTHCPAALHVYITVLSE